MEFWCWAREQTIIAQEGIYNSYSEKQNKRKEKNAMLCAL